MHNLIISCIVAFLVVIFTLRFLRPLAMRLGLVDLPGGRKRHNGAVPLTGGLGIFIGFCFSLLAIDISLTPYRSFIAGSAILIMIGILDDFHELSKRTRIAGQILAALMMTIWGGNVLYNLGDLLSDQAMVLGFIAIPFTVLATVTTINAVNMTDGIDGLAGSLCLVELIYTLVLATLAGQHSAVVVLLILTMALFGFLCLNFPTPKRRHVQAFMGDSGSMFLGFAIAWFLIELSQPPQQALYPVTILWILAIPLFDIATVIVRRIINKKSPVIGARDHLHHLLTSYGYGKLRTTLSISLLSIVFGAVGLLGYLYEVPENLLFFIFLCTFCGYFLIVHYLWIRINLLNAARKLI